MLDVTVAICTWNRSELLAQTLERFTDLRLPSGVGWEVIVVNNNCTDATDEVIAAFVNRLPLRRVFEGTPGLSNARNAAIRETRGRWLVFTDDDVLVDQNWISACLATAQRWPTAAVIGGRIEPWFVQQPHPDVLEAFPCVKQGFCGIDLGADERVLKDDEYVYGANMAYRADAIKGVWFDKRLGPTGTGTVNGDEVHYIRQLRAVGAQVVWSPLMKVKHYVEPSRLTVPYLSRYYRDHGRSLVRLGMTPWLWTPGSVLLGAPRWLWVQTAWAYVMYRATQLSQRRASALLRLRQYSFLSGLLMERRAMKTEPTASSSR